MITSISNFNLVPPSEENKYWAYYPGLFSDINFDKILAELQNYCVIYTNKIYG